MIVCCALLCSVDGWPNVLATHHWHLCAFPRLLWILKILNIGLGKLMVVDMSPGVGQRSNNIVYRCVWSLKYFEASYFRLSFDPRKCIWYVIYAVSLIPSSRNTHIQRKACALQSFISGDSLWCSLNYSYSHSHLWSVLLCPMISQKGFASGMLMQKILHSNSWTTTNGYIHRFWQTTSPNQMMESAKISQRLLQQMPQSRSSLCSYSLCSPFGGRTHVVAAAFSCLPSQEFARGTFDLCACGMCLGLGKISNAGSNAWCKSDFQQTNWVSWFSTSRQNVAFERATDFSPHSAYEPHQFTGPFTGLPGKDMHMLSHAAQLILGICVRDGNTAEGPLEDLPPSRRPART